MMKSFRLALAALFALAFALGGLSGAVSAKSTLVIADAPCHMATSMAAASSKQTAPCKGLKVDCVNQMGCVTISALPVHPQVHETPVEDVAIDYWAATYELTDFNHVPEPLPPRTI